MTKEEYLAFHKKCCEDMHEITKKKNSDYTGGSSDPFANFKRIGASNPKWVPVGFLTRMSDKFARLESFIEKGSFQVADESFLDTCLDLANYSILLAGYMASENSGPKQGAPFKFSVTPDKCDHITSTHFGLSDDGLFGNCGKCGGRVQVKL